MEPKITKQSTREDAIELLEYFYARPGTDLTDLAQSLGSKSDSSELELACVAFDVVFTRKLVQPSSLAIPAEHQKACFYAIEILKGNLKGNV